MYKQNLKFFLEPIGKPVDGQFVTAEVSPFANPRGLNQPGTLQDSQCADAVDADRLALA